MYTGIEQWINQHSSTVHTPEYKGCPKTGKSNGDCIRNMPSSNDGSNVQQVRTIVRVNAQFDMYQRRMEGNQDPGMEDWFRAAGSRSLNEAASLDSALLKLRRLLTRAAFPRAPCQDHCHRKTFHHLTVVLCQAHLNNLNFDLP